MVNNSAEALKPRLEEMIERDVATSELNSVTPERALRDDLVGLRMFEGSLVGYADASDPLFTAMKAPEAVGPQFMEPKEWLGSARSVVSFFLPHSKRVRETNYAGAEASEEWFQGRIEGQAYLNGLAVRVADFLEEAGFEAVVPTVDPRFSAVFAHDDPAKSFRSAWSERHVAYISGLGTFALSKGLITEKGICGRFSSVVTSAPFAATVRKYEGLYDYCIMCGACIDRCPVGAISLEGGKDHVPCNEVLEASKKRYPGGYYGCGKCQIGVPCETRAPRRR